MKTKLQLRYLFTLLFLIAITFSSYGQTTFTVTNNGDAGPGTLRQAIVDANAISGVDVIEFSAQFNIVLNSNLPQITDALIIDGTTVPGYSGTPLIKVESNTFGAHFQVNNANSIGISGIEFSTTVTGNTAIRVLGNVNSATITDNFIKGMPFGIWTEATNATITGNDFSNSGYGAGKGALRVRASGNLLVQNNIYGGAETGVLIEGSDLTIHNTFNPALTRQVVLEDGSGIHNYSQFCLIMGQNYTNYNIDGLNLSKTTDRTGVGIYILKPSTGVIQITNCNISGRTTSLSLDGLNSGNIVDYTIADNNFTNSGGSGTFVNPAVEIRQNAFTHGHVSMHSNTWGGPNANFGLRINGSSNLIIGDENVANADIVIEDNSGFNTYGNVGGFNAGFNMVLASSPNTLIDGVDFSRTTLLGTGLSVSGCPDATLRNLRFNQGRTGLEYSNSTNGVIEHSTFTSMTGFQGTGIFLGGSSTATISNSNFGCINTFAIDNNTYNPVNQIIAQNNFWEVAAAPNTGGTNGAQKYDGDVDATNFLTTPATTAPNGGDYCPALNVITDTDGDGINDDIDNCPDTFNPNQQDTNNNGIGDVCDVDCLATFLVGERGGNLSRIDADGNRTVIANVGAADGVTLLDANTAIVSRFNGSGATVLSVDLTTGASTNIASLSGASQGLTLDGQGNLYVTNEGLKKIQKINLSNNSVTDIVTGLNRPIDAILSLDGLSLLISEYNYGTLLKYELSSGTISTVASGMARPTDIYLESDTTVLIAENGGAVSRINLDNGQRTVVTTIPGGSYRAHGIAQFDDDNILVTGIDSNKVYKVNLTTGSFEEFATQLANPVFIARGACGSQILDTDGDGINDDVDNCPDTANADQADNDGDGLGDLCDDDDDNDGILDDDDNCPLISNSDQADNDGDGLGDVCDEDDDNDNVLDADDNCPLTANTDQADNDVDGLGDICDDDDDNDGVLDTDDNCAVIANADQLDSDGDGIGDVCDICPLDADNDIDGDGVCGDIDNCPSEWNEDQVDSDCDGVGDVCDVCPGGDDSVDNNNDGIADCSQVLSLEEYSEDWKCGNNNNKIILCHIPPGNPSNVQTLCISVNAIASHVQNHGCFVGPCVECSPEDEAVVDYEAVDPSGFAIYPNPATTNYNLDITDLEFSNARINIYDAQMYMVKLVQINESNRNNVMNFLTDNLQPGIYFVAITTDSNSYVKRLIINSY